MAKATSQCQIFATDIGRLGQGNWREVSSTPLRDKGQFAAMPNDQRDKVWHWARNDTEHKHKCSESGGAVAKLEETKQQGADRYFVTIVAVVHEAVKNEYGYGREHTPLDDSNRSKPQPQDKEPQRRTKPQ